MPARHLRAASLILRIVGALALVVAVTVIDLRVFAVNSSTAAFTYLLVILALATRVGLPESIAASLAGMVCYNFYFLPPVGTLTIADPQNWVALVVFLVTAVTSSQLSASARRRADEAGARRQEMEQLYEFSRALMLGDNNRIAASQISQQVVEIFNVQSAACYDKASDTTYLAGPEMPDLAPEKMRGVALAGIPQRDVLLGKAILPIGLGGQTLGSLGLYGMVLSEAALSAVTQLAAIAIERARSQREANRAEARRQNEQLKATLLDALAHEFKTPLTSMKAAVTTVLTQRDHDHVEQELLTIIDEETDHLTGLVTEAIKVARIEAGDIRLNRQSSQVHGLISSALFQLRGLSDGREIQVAVKDTLPEVDLDVDLIGLVLRQLISNALKYAPPSAAIKLSAEADEACMVIHVANDGPGIAVAEQEAIFEKFYRGQEARDLVPGTGMGLTIAREIVQSHGGRIWVESSPGKGVCFSLTLPLASKAEQNVRNAARMAL